RRLQVPRARAPVRAGARSLRARRERQGVAGGSLQASRDERPGRRRSRHPRRLRPRVAGRSVVNPAPKANPLVDFVKQSMDLEDLGLVRDVHRVQRGGAPSWTATFRPPLTLARLLSDPLLQYRIFVVSMKRYRDEVLARHRDAIGKDIEGKPATLSGLIAVSQHAGPALASWLANEADRRRFKQTTAAYGR